jgi:dTDP-glucose 4,6-dehydratase
MKHKYLRYFVAIFIVPAFVAGLAYVVDPLLFGEKDNYLSTYINLFITMIILCIFDFYDKRNKKNKRMKTYLVTGAAGFIGSNFIKYLLYKKYKDEDIKVIVLDALTYAGNLGTIKDDIDEKRCVFVKGDIRDRELADKLFAENDIDYVVNFAAESHVDRSIEDPQLFLSVNILGTQNLLDAARRAWVTGKDATGYPTWKAGKRFHQVSTDEVYGSLGADGFFTEKTPLCPHSPYSASKTSADMFVQAYRDTYHMPVSITRCSNNYGPYHFPEKLIPLIINNILAGKPLPVYGKGTNVRDWLYVEDHCKAIDLVVRKGREGEVYNVGGHNEMTNIDIVKLTIKTIHDMMAADMDLRKVLKKQEFDSNGELRIDWINDSLITYVTDRLGHDQRYAIDPSKIKAELGWYPETKFADGIVKTIRWNLENQDWIHDVTSGDYQKYYDEMYGNR